MLLLGITDNIHIIVREKIYGKPRPYTAAPYTAAKSKVSHDLTVVERNSPAA